MNTSYVKQYDANGRVINPIVGDLIHQFPNRRQRKQSLKKQRFYGESKNTHLTVSGNVKFFRVKQIIKLKLNGIKKTIEHYVLKK